MPYKCDQCGKIVSNPQALKWHKAKHERIKRKAKKTRESTLKRSDFFPEKQRLPEPQPQQPQPEINKGELMPEKQEEDYYCSNCNAPIRLHQYKCSACGEELVWQ